MALERFDIARDDLINRGLGTSALGSQRIQRMNIEDLHDLSGNLAESRATLEAEKQKRSYEATKIAMKNSRDVLLSSLGRGESYSFDDTKPMAAFVSNAIQPEQDQSGARFGVTIKQPGTNRGSISKEFSYFQEARDYAKELISKGYNVVLPSESISGLNQFELENLKVSGLIGMNEREALKRMYGITERTSQVDGWMQALGQFNSFSKGMKSDDKYAKEKKDKTSDIRRKIESNKEYTPTQNEQARYYDGAFTRALSKMKSPTATDNDRLKYSYLTYAAQNGKGFKAAKEYNGV